MNKGMLLRLFCCLAVLSIYLYQVIQKQNVVNYLSLQIPKLNKDLKTLEEREILRGNRGQGLARMQMKIVPTLDWPYDLTVDTTKASPFETATQVMEFVKNNPDPQSFQILRKRWGL